MSTAGSTRGHGTSHRRRDYRRSTKNEDPSDANVQSQRTSTVGLSRRHRGYQPNEVNKNHPKLEVGASSTTQEEVNATNPVAINNHPKVLTADDKSASTMTSKPSKPLPPHQTTLVKGPSFKHRPSPRTQIATLDASRPELDLVHFDGVSEPIDSEISSTQVITERKPSCWSIVSPPEDPPTEWNSSSANIDRPATKSLPVYHFSKSEHKAERNTASHSLNQQAKRKPIGTPQLASETNDGTQATARATSQEEDHAANSLHHQFQELQRDERLDAEQASQIKAIRDEVLARPMECQQSNVSTAAQDTARTTILDTNPSSIVPSLAKNKPLYVPPGKRSEVVPPHLRLQARQEPNKKDESLLGTSTSLSPTAAAEITAHENDLEHERHATSAAQGKRLPPHLRVPATTKDQGNKRPITSTVSLSTPSKKDDSYQPIIDMDEEIAATQPVLDIDEEIVAGLRAEASSAVIGAQSTDSNTGRTKEGTHYVSPPAGSKSKVRENQTKSQVDPNRDCDVGTNTRNYPSTAELYTTPPHEVVAIPDRPKSSARNGNIPAEKYVSVGSTSELIGWDGKMNQPPVEWNHRQPFNPKSNERLSVVEAWREDHAADPEENNRHRVDTASAVFQNGEGLVGSPIDRKDHETLAAKDDFTQARRDRSAADAIKDYEAKIAAKPKVIPSGIEGMTKEEKRRFRRALLEEERARRALPNPYAPAANIYLRPAEFKDMGQVTTIYNYYVRETSFVLHLDNVDELYWRSRLQEAENEKNPFVVAIHMGERSCHRQEDIIRKKQENVVGFAVAADFGGKDTVYHNTVELETMIHPEFYHQGTGRTLMDRILAALSPDHSLVECAPFLPQNDIDHWIRGGSRQAKAVLVNIHYSDGEEENIAWRKQWLAKYEFQHVGTLPHIGFKQGKLVNTCQMVLNTSARL